MKLAILILILLAFVIPLIEMWTQNASRKRRERDRAIKPDRMTHIAGSGRKWWKDPPGDGPEGDY